MKLIKYQGFLEKVRYDDYDVMKVERDVEKYEYTSYRKLVRILKKASEIFERKQLGSRH